MNRLLIAWCGKEMLLRRLVISPNLEEVARLREVATRLGLPFVEGQTPLQAGDLWVGDSPDGGWGDLAGETMWARSAEAETVIYRLEAARILPGTGSWAIEFRNGGFLQILEADNSGPASTAMRFNSKEETEAFMDQHQWTYHNGGMAKQVAD